jgi:hypothetical protein
VKVSIKDFAVNMDLGNNGLEFDVYDGDATHLGDFSVGKKYLTWCKGRTQRKNGKKVTWPEFIAWMESQ